MAYQTKPNQVDHPLDPVLRKCWMKRGHQKRVSLPKTSLRPIHLFGGYNWRDDTVNWTFFERRNSEGFVQWLEHLMLKTYPTQNVIVIADNPSFHKSKTAQAALALFEHRLQVLFLPPYATPLNPVEKFWNHLKSQVCGNRLFDNLSLLKLSIERFLLQQNDVTFHDRFILCK